MYFKQGRPEGKGNWGQFAIKEYRITLFYVLGEEGPKKGILPRVQKKALGGPDFKSEKHLNSSSKWQKAS